MPTFTEAFKPSLEHLRLGTIAVSSDQDSEESMDDNGNFVING